MKILFQRWRLSVFSALILLLTTFSRAGNVPHYSSRTWQTDDGLPHNPVAAIAQTSDGYLWIGTSEGLARFNGTQFQVYLPETNPGLNGRVIRALCEGNDGQLWIGTDDGGLSCWQNGEFSQPVPLLTGVAVKVIRRTRDGSLWIGTTAGLIRYQRGKTTWPKVEGESAPRIVVSLCEDTPGELWIGTTTGLQRLDHQTGKLLNVDPFQKMWISALMSDVENHLWIGTAGHGLFRYKDKKVTRFSETNRIPEGFVNALCEDVRGNLWIGTMGGLCLFKDKSILPQPAENGVSFDSIFCLTRDREDNLWLGTKDGLVQLRPRTFQSYTKENGLLHGNAMSVLEDQEANLWISTWGGGLNRLGTNGQIISFNHLNSGLNHDFPLALCQRRDGSIWIGCEYNGGLFRYQKRTDGAGVFVNYAPALRLIDTAVRVLHEDSQGRLWAGTSGGLYCYQNGKARRFSVAEGLPSTKVRAIMEDSQQRMWIGTEGGLALWKEDNFTVYSSGNGLSSDIVLSLYEDREQNLWIGTRSGGLCRMRNDEFRRTNSENTKLETRNSKFTSYTSKDGLFSDTISAILEDDHGYLWLTCFSGIFRVLKNDLDDFDQGKVQTIRCASYGKEDGMASVQCNGVSQPSGVKDKDGLLWFPTTRGVVVVDPVSVRESAPPPVVIEDIVVDKKRVQEMDVKKQESKSEKVGDQERESSPLPHFSTTQLLIPPGRGELEFHYAALSFRAPEQNRFKYKLEGVDPDWVEADTRRVAYYNNIEPGDYVFRVQGCNNEGIWNSVGANVKFTLQPHYWQTWWFKTSLAIACLSAVAAMARFLTRKKMRLKLQRLEQQHAIEKERTRIAQDMHDDLGAKLSEILLVSDLSGKKEPGAPELRMLVGRISSSVRELVDNLDAIVWAVNPRNDSLEKFALYVSEYVEMYLKATSLRYSLNIPNELPERMLSSETRHHLFLVIKEALHNIVKHAQASHVSISLRYDNDVLTVIIEDDGKGFSPERSSGFGNGVQNMEARIKNTGGSFGLSSQPEKGTRIQFQVPIANNFR